MQALFPPEIHEQVQNVVNPHRQTLEEWPAHVASYPGVRLQTQREAVTWFPLPLQIALYNAICEQWIFLKDNDTLGTVLYTRLEDTNTEDSAGYQLLHRMHHWSRAYAHLTHTVKVSPCVEGPEGMEMACKQPPLPAPQETEFDMGECTHVSVPWQYMGDGMHLCRHIVDCNMWLAVKGLQCADSAPDGEDDVPNCATLWVHPWWVPTVSNARMPRLNSHMGDVAFAFLLAAWGFTKQSTFEVMAFSQMAHY